MDICPIGYFHSPLPEKFGVPRQSGLAISLCGHIELLPEFAREEALKGLNGFSHIWIIWNFHLNGHSGALTVRPPRLGGNRSVGVFASRSPFRPNGLGLSAVKIDRIEKEKGIIHVLGADLADGTPIYDIKPYIPYSDCIPAATEGFTSAHWKPLKVRIPDNPGTALSPEKMRALEELLSLDPRPQYQNDPERIYGMDFEGISVKFKVSADTVEIISLTPKNG